MDGGSLYNAAYGQHGPTSLTSMGELSEMQQCPHLLHCVSARR